MWAFSARALVWAGFKPVKLAECQVRTDSKLRMLDWLPEHSNLALDVTPIAWRLEVMSQGVV